jgi:hypothetical protein
MEGAEMQRITIDLDGEWEVAQGGMDECPAVFSHRVPVPGLIDMAEPPFEEVGVESTLRSAFWYRRFFTVDRELPACAWLKLHKACYGTRVWLNGQEIGLHLPSFTPGWFDVRQALKGNGERNELVVRVGATRNALPDGMPKGFDFEKYLYIPGIYDSVELILSGRPRIVGVQIAPDIDAEAVRISMDLDATGIGWPIDVAATIIEDASKKVVTNATMSFSGSAEGEGLMAPMLQMPMTSCRLWSPEDPFLYRLNLETSAGEEGDTVSIRFGMREFRFDPETGRAMLNGKPYFMRGSNVTIYRFFEDEERGCLPWDREWVRNLHREFKGMHWNSLRYCIGFPPDFWYDIADEEGFLIQDEFPIWQLSGKALSESEESPDPLQAELIEPEYVEWMRERWNHACVVIWDAQNESFTEETGKALSAVRALDLSGRPWENGWAAPQAPTDCVEAHPYLFIRGWESDPTFDLSQMPTVNPVPPLQTAQSEPKVPILINEYGWLWLDREGVPTSLTGKVYEKLAGKDATSDERRRIWAYHLAALTEFWRSHRKCAGVLHFVSLSYSRPGDVPRPRGGATSDHWADVARLEWDPAFKEYMRDAFNPVGVMLDFWDAQVEPGEQRVLKVRLINDLYEDWSGKFRLRLMRAGRTLSSQMMDAKVGALGATELMFELKLPEKAGAYELRAELLQEDGSVVTSRRRFVVAENGG